MLGYTYEKQVHAPGTHFRKQVQGDTAPVRHRPEYSPKSKNNRAEPPDHKLNFGAGTRQDGPLAEQESSQPLISGFCAVPNKNAVESSRLAHGFLPASYDKYKDFT